MCFPQPSVLRLVWSLCSVHVAHNCNTQPFCPRYNTAEPGAVHPRTTLWIPWIGRTACSWPWCQLEIMDREKTAITRKQSHANAHNLSFTATMLAPCGGHSVRGKGVIFTAVVSVQSRPTWQSVSLLIGLILGGWRQDSIVSIIIHVTDITLCCVTHQRLLCARYVATMCSEVLVCVGVSNNHQWKSMNESSLPLN